MEEKNEINHQHCNKIPFSFNSGRSKENNMDLFIWQNNQCWCLLRGSVLISTQYLSFLINYPPSHDRGNRGGGGKEKNKTKQKKLLERIVHNKVRGNKIKRNARGTKITWEKAEGRLSHSLMLY